MAPPARQPTRTESAACAVDCVRAGRASPGRTCASDCDNGTGQRCSVGWSDGGLFTADRALAVAYSDVGTVVVPTNKVNTTRPARTRSARSAAPNRHYVVILSGG
jgi:hypothetical protein